MPDITSASNDRVKRIVRLQKQADARREAGAFCIETRRELPRALAGGFDVREAFVCEAMTNESVIDKISYRRNPQGFVVVFEAKAATLESIPLDPNRAPLILIASGLEKPGNLGAVLRTADAVGATAVFVDSSDYDLFNPNCIRASTGAVFAVPVIRDQADRLAAWLKENEIVILAATPEAELTYLIVNFRGPTAIVVGAEDAGLSDFWREAADLSVSIPMQGAVVDSLNVSISAAVLAFEAMRQRVG